MNVCVIKSLIIEKKCMEKIDNLSIAATMSTENDINFVDTNWMDKFWISLIFHTFRLIKKKSFLKKPQQINCFYDHVKRSATSVLLEISTQIPKWWHLETQVKKSFSA